MKRMVRHLIALTLAILFLVPVTCSVAGETQIGPDEILRHVKRAGAQQTVIDYYDKRQWPSILKGISLGSNDWLQVYVTLRPAADGGAGEDLGEAITEAIPRQPFKVLPVLIAETKSTAEELCTFTFESSIPKGGVNVYLDKLEKSLLRASNNEQRQLAKSCRQGVQATRVAFKSTQK